MTNREQIEGRGKELAGEIQQGFGKLTGNKGQQIKGAVKKTLGVAERKVGDLEERQKEREKLEVDSDERARHRDQGKA